MRNKLTNRKARKDDRRYEIKTHRTVLQRFFRNWVSVAALFILVLLCLCCICAPMLTSDSYDHMNTAVQFALPSRDHLFGCDYAGRDLFTRVLYGGRMTLRIALFSTVLAVLAGLGLGLYAGWKGKATELVIMRASEVLSAVPSILLVIFAEFLFGWGKGYFMYAMALAALPGVVRLTRASVLGVTEKEYIEAARALGVSPFQIIQRHILHNIAAPLLIHFTGMLAEAVLTCTLMGYIGIGVNPPQPEWGMLVYEGYTSMRAYPHTALFPAGTVILCVLCINLVGSGLRDALDRGEIRG